uniref:Reverse transcriptase domain-containing protein n=1 Tax=Caulerpa cliftonii TaxID=1004391 RepID=A0A1C9JBL7_9CHLO|nr:hypothetical protein [Caulerpa cliftonii]AOP19237.1 hypothetical protein [Caulerpa cliftonii]
MKLISWERVNWSLVETRVNRLQNRIYLASQEGFHHRVLFLQRILIRSLDAKLLAVRRVTIENRGRPGLDRSVYRTSSKKSRLVSQLRIDGKCAPIRRIMIPKAGKVESAKGPLGAKGALGIPIIRDRAKQALVLIALEPQWEARFEPNSYGFRPGRSPHDAVEAVLLSLRVFDQKNHQKYVVDADLKGCFDNIDHNYLVSKLDTLPIIQEQVRAWLKAGVFDGVSLAPELYGEIAENPIGTPQGEVISPFLCNVALHGMEQCLKTWIVSQSWTVSHRHQQFTANKKKSICLIRFADNFVIIHPDKEVTLGAKDEISRWLLSTSGLLFNEEKTAIRSSIKAFSFLGFSFINIKNSGSYRTKIYPSKKSLSRLVSKVGNICRKYRSISSYDLIKCLRPVIIGWANYFRYCECQNSFSKIDYSIFQIIRSWVFRRDRRHGRIHIKEKYFPSGMTYCFEGRRYKTNWILSGQKRLKGDVISKSFLPRISWVKSLKHVKVKPSLSPKAPRRERSAPSAYDGQHF